jgi:hypothetical protein
MSDDDDDIPDDLWGMIDALGESRVSYTAAALFCTAVQQHILGASTTIFTTVELTPV